MNGLIAPLCAGAGMHGFGPSASFGFATLVTALHHQFGLTLGLGDSYLRSGGAGLALVAGGTLWTAVELSATSGGVPGRRLLALLGKGVLLGAAPLASLGLTIGLFMARPEAGNWPAAVALLAFFAISAITFVVGWEMLAGTSLFRKPVLIIGRPSDWLELGTRLAPGYDPTFFVAGVVALDDRRNFALNGFQSQRIWGVVASSDATLQDADLSERCSRARVRLLGASEFRERLSRKIDVDHAEPDAFSRACAVRDSVVRAFTRRIFDIGLSLLLVILALPVAALAAMLIKLDSRGPIFYTQERVGLHGRPFLVVKFRSMHVNAEAESGPQWAGLGDPRVTRIGGLLRRTRIDELPQLWNVLRGEMSMVGPRPERPYFVTRLAAELPCYSERALVKPGITGWAQVNYRYGASVEDARAKLAYDLYYVKHRNALLDLRILAATVRVVLSGQGAR